jgi:ribose transport system substrate-binding protein
MMSKAIFRKTGLIVVLLIAGIALVGAGGQGEAASVDVSDLHIGFSTVAMNAPYFVAMERAARETAERLGVRITILNADNDVSKQIDDINNLMVQGIDGLIVNSVTEYGTMPVIKQVTAEGIPVVAIDRNLYGDYVAYVGIDQWRAGVLQGEYIAGELLPDGGNIVLLAGDPGGSANIGRMNGMMSVLDRPENEGRYNILGTYAAYYNRSQGLDRMEEAIAAHGNAIDLVYAANDSMALGAMEALREAGMTNVLLAGIDGQKEGYQAIRDTDQYKSTVVNNSWEITQIAVRILVDHLATGSSVEEILETIKSEDSRLAETVFVEDGKNVITGTVLVTEDNVNEFYDPNAVF